MKRNKTHELYILFAQGQENRDSTDCICVQGLSNSLKWLISVPTLRNFIQSRNLPRHCPIHTVYPTRRIIVQHLFHNFRVQILFGHKRQSIYISSTRVKVVPTKLFVPALNDTQNLKSNAFCGVVLHKIDWSVNDSPRKEVMDLCRKRSCIQSTMTKLQSNRFAGFGGFEYTLLPRLYGDPVRRTVRL